MESPLCDTNTTRSPYSDIKDLLNFCYRKDDDLFYLMPFIHCMKHKKEPISAYICVIYSFINVLLVSQFT